MAQTLWGRANLSTNAPKFVVQGSTSSSNNTNIPTGTKTFVNTTPNIFVNNQIVTTFGVNTASATSFGKGVSPGWVSRKLGTGPVASVSLAAATATAPNPAGLGFSNGNIITFSNGTTNAVATITTNTVGAITSFSLVGGRGFVNVATTVVAVTNSTGGAAAGNTAIAAVFFGAGATPGGTGYSNTNLVRVSNGTSNASATITTNTTGGITAFAITTPGTGFINVAASVVAITNATGGGTGVGTGANVTIQIGPRYSWSLGGRAGRVELENLVVFRGSGTNITGANTPLT